MQVPYSAVLGAATLPRLAGLQGLRALAAIMVLLGHVIAETEHYFAIDLPGDAIPWTRGVDIFFVISGFIIALSAQRYQGKPLAFLRRRLWRVVPLYFLFTALMVVTLLLMPGAAKDTSLEPGQIISSYLFLPYERHDGRIAPVLSLGWTLNFEVFFYVITAFCLFLSRPILALSLALTALSVFSLVPGKSVALTFWTNPLVLEFLFGVALARIYQRRGAKGSWRIALALLAFGLCLLILLDATDLPRFLAAGFPAMLIVASGTLFCPHFRIPLQGLGDASYALYLSHRFTMRVLTLALLPILPTSAAWLFVGLTCVACLGVGLLVHRNIERPLLQSQPHRPGAPA
jgi:exopolysaccharide production protein ExoZ